jgi:nitrogenase-stabilizing/protective protein
MNSSNPMNPNYHLPPPEENMMEDTLSLAEAMEDLVSAEDFLEFFEIPYEPSVVHVNRLHILQRFHDYLAKQAPNLPPEEEQQRGIYRLWLERAYQDFVNSNSINEKVFAVFQNQAKPEGGFSSFISLDKVFRE